MSASLLAYAAILTPPAFNVKLWEFMLDFPLAVLLITTYFFFSDSLNQKHFTVKKAMLLGGLSGVSLLTKRPAVVSRPPTHLRQRITITFYRCGI